MKPVIRYPSPYKKIRTPILFFGTILTIGIAGYMIIEKYNFSEGLYMTIITLSTVGFGEVKPLSDLGRMFTVVLIILNIGEITYFLTLMSQYIFEGHFFRDYKLHNMEKQLQKISNHVIVCGYGRNGQSAIEVLQSNHIPFIVIDKESKTAESNTLIPYMVQGDATTEKALLEAGIMRAKALISTLPEDADNVFCILTAKELNPNILIISRASHDTSISKLKHAGAHNVIMPDKIGGVHMAQLVSHPDLKEFLDILAFQNKQESSLVELIVTKQYFCDKAEILKSYKVLVLGIKNIEQQYDLSTENLELLPGYRIIVLGKQPDIEKLEFQIT